MSAPPPILTVTFQYDHIRALIQAEEEAGK